MNWRNGRGRRLFALTVVLVASLLTMANVREAQAATTTRFWCDLGCSAAWTLCCVLLPEECGNGCQGAAIECYQGCAA